MTIASAIVSAQGKVADAYTAVSTKGGTLPATQDLSNLPTAINSIPAGSVVVPVRGIHQLGAGKNVYYNLLVSGTTAPTDFVVGHEPDTILNKSNAVTISSGTYTLWEGVTSSGMVTDFHLIATITF